MNTKLKNLIFTFIIISILLIILLFYLQISLAEATSVVFNGLFEKPQYLSTVLIKACPIILTGLSVALAMQVGLFNLGAEGQYIFGAIFSTLAGVYFNYPPIIQIPLIIAIGSLAGGILGYFIAKLKFKFHIHEVLSSIMFNWIALNLQNYFVLNSFIKKDFSETSQNIHPNGSLVMLKDFKLSQEGLDFFSQYPFWQSFFKPSFHYGFFWAVLATIILLLYLYYTPGGIRLRMIGKSLKASQYVGIHVEAKSALFMSLSGMLAASAGAITVMGFTQNISVLSLMEGNGFDGLSASLIGFFNPLFVFIASIFLAALKYSGQKLQAILEMPSEISQLIIGLIILCLSIPKFTFKTNFKFKYKKD